MGKVMVTGALGNVGGYVTKHLLLKSQDVVAADISIKKLRDKFGDSVECRYFNFIESETYDDALKGVDRVFIMRPPHLGDPKDLKPFIEKLKEHNGIKLVSLLSLIGIENNPVPPHYKIEKYIEKADLPYCHIRPSFFMQNLSGVHAHEIKHFDKIVVPVKNAKTSFIDAEDIGEIISEVFSNPQNHTNKAYSITGGKALSYHEVAKIMTSELGRDIEYINPSPSFAKKYWINVRGIEKKYATVMSMLYMMTRMGTANKVTNVFEAVIGKKPQTFSDFVRKNKLVW